MEEKPFKRAPVYEFQALPKYETYYYFLFIFIGAFYVYPQVYIGSQMYTWTSELAEYEESKLPFFGTRRKDITNDEWRWWTPYAWKVLPWLIGHSILFNVTEKLLPSNYWRMFMLIYWLTACLNLYGIILVVISLVLGIVMYSFMRVTKSKAVVWLISASAAVIILHIYFDELPVTVNIYMTAAFLAYKLLQYISFCLEECERSRTENVNFLNGFYNMLWYAFYLPYANSLIVIYRHFPEQIEQRRKPRNWFYIIFFAVKTAFWYFLIEFMLHFLYFNAICTDAQFLSTVNLDMLLIMGYVAGQFFQMEYVVIFGLPASFARIDNMQPPKGPICISRVTLYSKMWRNFDRGFYEFFKVYIFLPICRPTFSVYRKIFGVLLSYSFVLIWHGVEHEYVVWVVLNVIELFIETSAKIFYLIPSVRRWREDHLSDHWFRRILALLICCPWAFGCYGNFYFLTNAEVGYHFFERLFWGYTVTLRWQFFLLVFCGYHLSNVSIDIERWLNSQKDTVKDE